jgi:hypothetical protein
MRIRTIFPLSLSDRQKRRCKWTFLGTWASSVKALYEAFKLVSLWKCTIEPVDQPIV